MHGPFTIRVPVDERYRVLAVELAGKYVEVSGGTAADGRALASALATALDRLAAHASDQAEFDLAYRVAGGQIEVAIGGVGHPTVVRQPLTVPNL